MRPDVEQQTSEADNDCECRRVYIDMACTYIHSVSHGHIRLPQRQQPPLCGLHDWDPSGQSWPCLSVDLAGNDGYEYDERGIPVIGQVPKCLVHLGVSVHCLQSRNDLRNPLLKVLYRGGVVIILRDATPSRGQYQSKGRAS